MNEYVYNTMYNAVSSLFKLQIFEEEGLKNYDCVVVGNEHDLSYLLAGTYQIMKKYYPQMTVHMITTLPTEGSPMFADMHKQWKGIKIWNSLEEYWKARDAQNGRPEFFIDVANLRRPVFAEPGEAKQEYERKEAEIRSIMEYNMLHKDNLFQLVTCIPAIAEPLPEVTTAIAEREYEVIYRDYAEDSPQKFVTKMEDIIRSYSQIIDHTQVMRVDRIFGPGIYSDDGLGITAVFEEIKSKHKVTVYDKDRYDYFSAAYVRDALFGCVIAAITGRKGNIYHVSTWELNRLEVVFQAMKSFTNLDIQLETVHDGLQHKKTYRMLNARKLRLAHPMNIVRYLATPKVKAIQEMGDWYFETDTFLPENEITVYFGRMDRIRELELSILDEVDRICKENHINYFLAAGTMLGAVRHKGFIPWDDDVDIGMLPEDYEKFLKVCPQSLDVEYGYQNVTTESSSHYIHDKIRLKNSFFSTKYSDRYPMLNGVYIDVFVYYKTSNKKFWQNMHIKQLAIMRQAIGIRWAIRKKPSRLYNILFTISHWFPAKWYDNYYRHLLMKYNRRKTNYRIDGGFNLEKVRAFPDEWFHGTIDAEFCGKKYPILEHYKEYLTHWYSKNYMKLLPITDRISVHDVVRIDLGQNLFEETRKDPRFRDVDLRGELYEVEKQ